MTFFSCLLDRCARTEAEEIFDLHFTNHNNDVTTQLWWISFSIGFPMFSTSTFDRRNGSTQHRAMRLARKPSPFSHCHIGLRTNTVTIFYDSFLSMMIVLILISMVTVERMSYGKSLFYHFNCAHTFFEWELDYDRSQSSKNAEMWTQYANYATSNIICNIQ